MTFDSLSDDYAAGYQEGLDAGYDRGWITGTMETLAALRQAFKGSDICSKRLVDAIKTLDLEQYTTRSRP